MDNEIYAVERDDYAAFIGQLNKNLMDVVEKRDEDTLTLQIFSQKTNKHLCSRVITLEDGNEEYFIFNYPDSDERIAPKPVMKITLETKEEVQEFFNILNKIELEAHKNDGTLS